LPDNIAPEPYLPPVYSCVPRFKIVGPPFCNHLYNDNLAILKGFDTHTNNQVLELVSLSKLIPDKIKMVASGIILKFTFTDITRSLLHKIWCILKMNVVSPIFVGLYAVL